MATEQVIGARDRDRCGRTRSKRGMGAELHERAAIGLRFKGLSEVRHIRLTPPHLTLCTGVLGAAHTRDFPCASGQLTLLFTEA